MMMMMMMMMKKEERRRKKEEREKTDEGRLEFLPPMTCSQQQAATATICFFFCCPFGSFFFFFALVLAALVWPLWALFFFFFVGPLGAYRLRRAQARSAAAFFLASAAASSFNFLRAAAAFALPPRSWYHLRRRSASFRLKASSPSCLRHSALFALILSVFFLFSSAFFAVALRQASWKARRSFAAFFFAALSASSWRCRSSASSLPSCNPGSSSTKSCANCARSMLRSLEACWGEGCFGVLGPDALMRSPLFTFPSPFPPPFPSLPVPLASPPRGSPFPPSPSLLPVLPLGLLLLSSRSPAPFGLGPPACALLSLTPPLPHAHLSPAPAGT